MSAALAALAVTALALAVPQRARTEIIYYPTPIVVPVNTGASLTSADGAVLLTTGSSFSYIACPPYCPPRWDVSDFRVYLYGELEGDPSSLGSNGMPWVLSLTAGSPVGPQQQFVGGGFSDTRNEPVDIIFRSNLGLGLVGIAFNDDGQEHYGWASIGASRGGVTVSGYAYESCADTPILAGATSDGHREGCPDPDPDPDPTPEPGTLGLLGLAMIGFYVMYEKNKARSTRDQAAACSQD